MPEMIQPVFGDDQRKAFFRIPVTNMFLQEPSPVPNPCIILLTPRFPLQSHVVWPAVFPA